MQPSAQWYDAERVSQPGSVILNTWRAERQASRLVTAPKAQDLTGLSMSEFADWVKGTATTATGVVTERTAMSIGAVYACVSLIGGALASLPLSFFRRSASGDRERYVPPEWWMLNEQPFSSWSAAAAWEYSAWSLLLMGDSFWRIHRKGPFSPEISGFEPLHPASVAVRRTDDRLLYTVGPQPSQAASSPKPATVTLDQDDMLHVPGPGFDGLRGMSQIQSALRQAGGVALSADEYMASFFRNSARPDFVLEADGNISTDQLTQLRAQWTDVYGGASRSWKPAVLTGGLKVKPITLTATDSQLLETRKFQVEDICRIFGVPPHMVGQATTSSWGTGIEQMSIGFVKYTLQRHLVKFEQEINRKIFRTGNRFCEFETAGLERGDIKTRYEAYRIALGRAGEQGWMTPNQIRRLENQPAIDGGDELNDGEGTPNKEDLNEPTPASAG